MFLPLNECVIQHLFVKFSFSFFVTEPHRFGCKLDGTLLPSLLCILLGANMQAKYRYDSAKNQCRLICLLWFWILSDNMNVFVVSPT